MAVSNSTDRFNGAVTSLAIKVHCVVASAVNEALTGSGQTINGVVVNNNDRVLLVAQTDPVENGIWVVDDGLNGWVRAPDWDGNRDIQKGTLVAVSQSGVSADTLYQVDAPTGDIMVGIDAVTIIELSLGSGVPIILLDNEEIQFGDGTDVRMFFDGTDFQIVNDAGVGEFSFGAGPNYYIFNENVDLGGNDLSLTAGGAAQFFEAGNSRSVQMQLTGNDIVVREFTGNSNSLRLEDLTLIMEENSAAPAATAAFGQIWVRNDAPNNLLYRDDTGVDYVIGGALMRGYHTFAPTNRIIGFNAGQSQTGDAVIFTGTNAGENNIADDVIAIGHEALNDAVQLDFAGTIAIGNRAGQLLDDTRDPWLIIGTDAVASLPGGAFHDANTVIGYGALQNVNTGNLQANVIIGWEAVNNMVGGAVNSSVVIGAEAAGNINVNGSISSSVVIGRRAGRNIGSGSALNCILIGDNVGEALSGAIRNVMIGSQCMTNAVNHDECVYIGYGLDVSTGTAVNNICIGSQALGTQIGDANVILGAFFNTSGLDGFDRCVMMGSASGNDHVVTSSVFCIEVPQSQSSFNIHPFLYGDMNRCNLALLSLADTSLGTEGGASIRVNPIWDAIGSPIMSAGEGIFTLSGEGTDPGVVAGTPNHVHLFVRSADNYFGLQFNNAGERIAFGTDGTDVFIENSVGDLVLNAFVNINAADPLDVQDETYFTGVNTPSALGAGTTNNWAPSLAGATRIEFSGPAAADVTGLAGGTDGRMLILTNVGANAIIFRDENASSTAANRFGLNGDITIGVNESVMLLYSGTVSRWTSLGSN